MKKASFTILFVLLHLVVYSQFDRNSMSPRELTLSFIEDYKKWNDFAFNSEKDDVLIEEKYKNDIINKYCLTSKKYKNISFGSESSHCPLKEKIVFENTRTNVSVVTTKYKDIKLGLVENFEYHFVKFSGKWYLNEVYNIDKEGKYEGL
jgi:hypothetical protein